ncbi:MAG: hypothetical protein AB7D57_00765 [Desulfovibrionaceae bacterium]
MSVTPAITSFTGGELSPRLAGRVDLAKYFSGCAVLENFLVWPHGGATRRSGLRFAAEAKDHGKKSRLVPFEFNAEETYVLEFGDGFMRVFTDYGIILADEGTEPYEIETPYAEADLAGLGYAQSADKLYLTHRGYAPRVLTRTGHTAWTLSTITFAPVTPTPTGVSAVANTSGSTVHKYRVTGQGELDESLASDPVQCSAPEDLGDNASYYNTISWTDDGLEYHYVYKEKNGLWAFQGRSSGTSYVDTGDAEPDESSVVLEARNPFENEGDWPKASCFGDERLDVGGSVNDPSKIFGSAVGSYFDFRVSPEDVEPTDNESLEVTLSARQLNAIEWMIQRGDNIFVGTGGGTWLVGGAGGEVLTPGNVRARMASAWGSAPVRPVLAEESVLYVQRAEKKILEMAYSFETDSYPSTDMTLLAEHITGDGVIEMDFAQAPDCTLLAVRKDGQLAACTFMRSQEVVAWSRIVTDGAVESVACVFDAATGRDIPWMVVRRTIAGEEKRFIEYLEEPFNGEVRDAFFVDAGVSFDLEEDTTYVDGLGHLAGATVAVLADGSTHPDAVVQADGTLDLARPARRIHVGLPYTSTLEPMPLEAGSPRGTAQSKRKLVTQVNVRFYQTVGGLVGKSEASLETVVSRLPTDPMDEPVPARSGDKRVDFGGGWDSGGRIIVKQEQPLPMTVLMIVPTIIVNE